LPQLPTDDEGIWRRASVVPFKSCFVDNPNPNDSSQFKRDYDLKEVIPSWKSAFMYVLLEYYKLYKSEGLKEPQAVREKTLSYRQDQDTILEFLNDTIEKGESQDYVLLKDLWSNYKRFEGYDKRYKLKDFKTIIMKKLNLDIPERKRINDTQVRSPIVGYKEKSDEVVETDKNKCVL